VPELIAYLEALCARHAGTTAVLALAEILAEQGQVADAKRRLVAELQHRPTVRGIDRLIDYSLDGAGGETRDNLVVLKELTVSLINRKAHYQCGNCGFKGRSLHWQCPSCKSWSTVKPIHGIEGE
jgi:lipopolysaccharide assembly protein B